MFDQLEKIAAILDKGISVYTNVELSPCADVKIVGIKSNSLITYDMFMVNKKYKLMIEMCARHKFVTFGLKRPPILLCSIVYNIEDRTFSKTISQENILYIKSLLNNVKDVHLDNIEDLSVYMREIVVFVVNILILVVLSAIEYQDEIFYICKPLIKNDHTINEHITFFDIDII